MVTCCFRSSTDYYPTHSLKYYSLSMTSWAPWFGWKLVLLRLSQSRRPASKSRLRHLRSPSSADTRHSQGKAPRRHHPAGTHHTAPLHLRSQPQGEPCAELLGDASLLCRQISDSQAARSSLGVQIAQTSFLYKCQHQCAQHKDFLYSHALYSVVK